MFNTGDLGRWMPNGVLEHLGRVDDQVKVKVSTLEHSCPHNIES
jgi:non-ribosomal peptide synthetase component F